LARLLAHVRVGIAINEHTDEDSAVVFLHACKMGLEGIVSYRSQIGLNRIRPWRTVFG
jgi:ATP-dependent DNA ligase